MALTLCSDLGVADWLVRSGTDAEQLINFGPSGFEAYARLRFIPDPSHPGQSEADVVVEAAHLSDIAQTQRALRILGRFSGSPSDWYFCVWDGFSDVELHQRIRRPPSRRTNRGVRSSPCLAKLDHGSSRTNQTPMAGSEDSLR